VDPELRFHIEFWSVLENVPQSFLRGTWEQYLAYLGKASYGVDRQEQVVGGHSMYPIREWHQTWQIWTMRDSIPTVDIASMSLLDRLSPFHWDLGWSSGQSGIHQWCFEQSS
jgi:hypothetical protein